MQILREKKRNVIVFITSLVGSFLLLFVFVSTAVFQSGINLNFLQDQVRSTQVWKLLDDNYKEIIGRQRNKQIRSASISRITRSGSYQFWGFYLNTLDRNFLLAPEDESHAWRVEAVMSDCGYVLIQTSFDNIEKIYTDNECIPRELIVATSSFVFSDQYIVKLKAATDNKFLIR
jgi:hypothetical protein